MSSLNFCQNPQLQFTPVLCTKFKYYIFILCNFHFFIIFNFWKLGIFLKINSKLQFTKTPSAMHWGTSQTISTIPARRDGTSKQHKSFEHPSRGTLRQASRGFLPRPFPSSAYRTWFYHSEPHHRGYPKVPPWHEPWFSLRRSLPFLRNVHSWWTPLNKLTIPKLYHLHNILSSFLWHQLTK